MVLVDFVVESSLGILVLFLLLCEFGFVVIVLFFVGWVGLVLIVEIGLMKVIE